MLFYVNYIHVEESKYILDIAIHEQWGAYAMFIKAYDKWADDEKHWSVKVDDPFVDHCKEAFFWKSVRTTEDGKPIYCLGTETDCNTAFHLNSPADKWELDHWVFETLKTLDPNLFSDEERWVEYDA